MSKISIVIVNYNTKKYILPCIASVFEKTTDVDFEVIVVDNASIDDSCDAITAQFPQIKVIKNDKNLGFGMANNVGMKEAQGKYIFLLNPDTVLVNNAVKILHDFMEKNPKCGACGGNLYDEDHKPVHAFGYGDDIKSLLIRKTPLKLLLWGEYKKIKNYEKKADKSKTQQVRHITGADLMLRKGVIDVIGGFSPDFFLYFEETELEFRIKKAGYELWFVPDSKILHLEGKATNPMRDKFYIGGFIAYYRLCYGAFWGHIAKFLQLGRILKFRIKTRKVK